MKSARLVLVATLAVSCWFSAVPARAEQPDPELKSGSSALLYSLLGTALPVGVGLAAATGNEGPNASPAPGLLVFSGAIFGPSLGHFYAGRPGRALGGIGLRVLGGAGMVAGFAMSWDRASDSAGGGDVLFGAGAALWIGSAVWDIASAPHSARVQNEKARKQRASLGVAAVGASRAPGLRLDVPF